MLYRARVRGLSPFSESAEKKGTVPLGAPVGVAIEKWFGIRRLGTKGRSLVLETRRWVPRGICLARITADDLNAARDAGAVLVGPPPEEEICLEASRHGVPLIIEIGNSGNLLNEARRLAPWPAVFLLLFEPDALVDASIRAAARNVLFAVKSAAGEISVPPWAQAILCDADPDGGTQVADCQLPVFVRRRLSSAADIRVARSACDRLQYDMVPNGDFAGYLV